MKERGRERKKKSRKKNKIERKKDNEREGMREEMKKNEACIALQASSYRIFSKILRGIVACVE